MISIPEFTQCSDNSFLSASLNDQLGIERKPSTSSSITLANVNSLVEDGIELIEGRQVKAGLRKLKQALPRIENQENATNQSVWMVKMSCLFYISYALDYLESQEEMLANNQELISLIARYFSTFNESPSNSNLRLKLFYCYFLIFTASKLTLSKKFLNSYKLAKKAHQILIQIFQSALDEDLQASCSSDQNYKVQFSRLILEKALPKIKIILQCERHERIQSCPVMKNIKALVSSWKINPEKNIKELKSQMKKYSVPNQESSKRSLLGVKQIGHKSKQVNNSIDNTFLIQIPKSEFDQISAPQTLLTEISDSKLSEKIEKLSIAHYLLASNLYHIQDQNFLEKQPTSIKIKTLLSNKKNSERLLKSQVHYMKSISMVMLFLQDRQQYIQFFIRNFQEKFSGDMIEIEEEDSKLEASSSYRFSKKVAAEGENQDPEPPTEVYYNIHDHHEPNIKMKKTKKQSRLQTNECSYQSLKKQVSFQNAKFMRPPKKCDKALKDKSLSRIPKSFDLLQNSSIKSPKIFLANKSPTLKHSKKTKQNSLYKNQSSQKLLIKALSKRNRSNLKRR